MVACHARPLPEASYGASELKAAARAYLSRATIAGSGLWVLLFLIALVASALYVPRIVPVAVPHPLLPPPKNDAVALKFPAPPSVAPSKPNMFAVPIPTPSPPPIVEDHPVVPPGPTTAPGGGQGTVPTGGPGPDSAAFVDARPDPNVFEPVDELPVGITKIEPEYPGLAREAGVEGTVVVRVLVGKDGRVREAFVDPKASVPMLDEAALTAARDWVFKPAITNNHPVAVWVAITMRFTLH